MTLWLAPHVHAAALDEDLVFLDVETDAYFCLAGGGRHLRLRGDGAVEPRPARAADDLVAAGLLDVTARPRSPLAPPAVASGLPDGRPAITVASLGTALVVNRLAARAVATLPFKTLLEFVRPLAPQALVSPSKALLDDAGRFSAITPWLPRDGVCLMRSLQQRLFLERRGHAAAWVFGVRTWPFEAHCWLQAGPVVLDDAIEHVRSFTPILTV